MKKILFLVVAIIMFASCSNDSEDVSPTGEKYKVTFNVSNFITETNPLKSAETHSNYCYYTIYEKETGKAVKYKTILTSATPQITEEVEAGNYYIAIFSVPTTINSPRPTTPDEDINLNQFNYNTDYFDGISWMVDGGRNNQYTYYEKVSFTASATNEKIEMDVVLQPMWSVIDIEVTDADACILPEGTNVVICTVNPFYYGFGIANGIPSKSKDDPWMAFYANPSSDNTFRTKKGVYNKVVSASKNVTVKLAFITWSESNAGTLLGERVIYEGDLEGGKHITLKGTLGKSTSGATFSPILGNLGDGGTIPFE